MKEPCHYPLFEQLIGNSQKDEVIAHTQSCRTCQERLILWELLLPYLAREQDWQSISQLEGEELDEIFGLVDAYQKKSFSALEEKKELFRKIMAQERAFLLFQKLVGMYQAIEQRRINRLPLALKKHVLRSLETQDEVNTGRIFLVLGEKLRLMGSMDLGLKIHPVHAIALRSLPYLAKPEEPHLSFSMPYGKGLMGELFYQVVKDGNESLLLTVGIHHCEPQPRIVNLKRDGRLLHSYPVREKWLYFPHLTVGHYELEFKDSEGRLQNKVDLELVRM
ncbi:MAG: hypothetical protein NZM25_07820 [Leptospiraceae bacterium]|nr:hypothetical protein [Leptospiraceae bacterium]MDW8305507.1 hypothetical protein [Leptospiraceae bacterium]